MPCSPIVLKRVKWLLCAIFQGLQTAESNFNSLFSQSGSQKWELGAKKRKKNQTKFQLLDKSKMHRNNVVWFESTRRMNVFILTYAGSAEMTD